MPIPRHTKSRQAVLRAVKLSPQAISAEQVMKQVKLWWPDANQATVYRNLDFLKRRGEIYRVEGPDGIKRYIGHSFHEVRFRCQRCGKERELPSESLQQYVNREMSRKTRGGSHATQWGNQTVFFSRLTAQGLCGNCLRVLGRHHPGASRHPSLVRKET